MRILYIDIDSLRPDHLGCYGYQRNTSSNIDRIAHAGVRFENCYVSDAPCLPSRTALFSGCFGIHTGVVGHGGTAADLLPEGPSRGFRSTFSREAWMTRLTEAGYHTATISPFAERHSAWHFLAGFREMHNTGHVGMECAHEVQPHAIKWLEQNAADDNWFLHLNYWDPHEPYRTPEAYGNPFENDPLPAWHTEEVLEANKASFGSHGAMECDDHGAPWKWKKFPRVPNGILSMEDWKLWVDGYDIGIKYADDHVGELLALLEKKGVLDDTVIIVSADHAENMGELNVYGDHQTADHATCRIPLIIKGPGITSGADEALHYNVDLAPTIMELAGGEPSEIWDGQSFLSTLKDGTSNGRPYLVISQCAHSCMRSVRWEDWMLIRTYHDGYKNLLPIMLFNLAEDPYEQHNLAETQPEITNKGLRLLDEWHSQAMAGSRTGVDPMQTVMQEGGPFHAHRVSHLDAYLKRLQDTGRAHHAKTLAQRHGVKWP